MAENKQNTTPERRPDCVGTSQPRHGQADTRLAPTATVGQYGGRGVLLARLPDILLDIEGWS